jgi:hypothetical protein
MPAGKMYKPPQRRSLPQAAMQRGIQRKIKKAGMPRYRGSSLFKEKREEKVKKG